MGVYEDEQGRMVEQLGEWCSDLEDRIARVEQFTDMIIKYGTEQARHVAEDIKEILSEFEDED